MARQVKRRAAEPLLRALGRGTYVGRPDLPRRKDLLIVCSVVDTQRITELG